jgi:hypothetical protein
MHQAKHKNFLNDKKEVMNKVGLINRLLIELTVIGEGLGKQYIENSKDDVKTNYYSH